MKFLKKLKKNNVVIYAIILMLFTAGYFNYTANNETSETSTYMEAKENTTNSDDTNTSNDENIGDARMVSSNWVDENIVNTTNTSSNTSESSNIVNENNTTNTISDDSENAVNTNSNIENNSNSDYFANSKLERDKTYASMISTYTKILNDSSISETEKSIAMKEITNINNNKNAISICENLITTKGFSNCVIFVNQDSVNVIIGTDGELSKDKVAKIQNIVSREFKCEIENIHISQK